MYKGSVLPRDHECKPRCTHGLYRGQIQIPCGQQSNVTAYLQVFLVLGPLCTVCKYMSEELGSQGRDTPRLRNPISSQHLTIFSFAAFSSAAIFFWDVLGGPGSSLDAQKGFDC